MITPTHLRAKINMNKERKASKDNIDTKAAVQSLEYLLAAGYVNKKRLYFENFMRGIFFSVGSILGAAVFVAFLLWLLTLFNNIPFIGDIAKSIQRSLNN